VTLHPEGTVAIVCHRSEMGQGIRTTMPPPASACASCRWESNSQAGKTAKPDAGGGRPADGRGPLAALGAADRAQPSTVEASRPRSAPASRSATP
jgi:hypothetical protein